MALIFEILIGFIIFCLIGLISFLVYLYLDKKLEKKPYKDLVTYLSVFIMAFGLAIISAPFMGYGENPLRILFK
jgi:NhaP-type Na+/H+ or K+/H+ antiporter